MTTPTPGPGQPGQPAQPGHSAQPEDGGTPPSGPWASDNLPPPPHAAYQPVEVPQPPSIRTAVRLMYVGAALSLLGLLTLPFQTDAIRDAIEDSDSSLTASEVDTAVTFAVGFAVVIGLVGVGLWVWMAVKNGQGLSWARVVATVLGGLNILSTLFNLASGQSTGITIALNLVSLALAAAILVLLYRPESSRFYDFRSR